MNKRKRGRPFGSFKFKIENKPVPISEYKKWLTKNKPAELRPFDLSDYKIDKRLHEKIERALKLFNLRHSTQISKSDFIRMCLSHYSEAITGEGLR